MAHTRYWFSPKQKRMRDALSGEVTRVRVGSEWVEYTQSTTDGVEPTVWNDFRLVAEGDGLECSSEPAGPVMAAEVVASAVPCGTAF